MGKKQQQRANLTQINNTTRPKHTHHFNNKDDELNQTQKHETCEQNVTPTKNIHKTHNHTNIQTKNGDRFLKHEQTNNNHKYKKRQTNTNTQNKQTKQQTQLINTSPKQENKHTNEKQENEHKHVKTIHP